jgi:bifunctional pyridoxal-dependent enzyme with beta-cystathionase and maltose regulon repressor activities
MWWIIKWYHSCVYHDSFSGAVYNAEHLQKIIDLCEKYSLPIIADEIYADMVN